LLKQDKYTQAQRIYAHIAKQFPYSHQGLQGLSHTARRQGEFQECLDYANQLIKNFPGLPVGYQEAEQAYIEIGKFKNANKMFLQNPVKMTQQHKRVIKGNLPEGLVLPEIQGKNNDYSFIETALEQFIASKKAYNLPVSVIIPVYNRKALLAKTLAALTHQTYPKDLIEIVVADDGSSDGVEEVIQKYQNILDLQYVFQADQGYRLAAVRNLGMKNAKYEHFIILDCDVLPVPEFVESHMKYFHVSQPLVTIGHIRYVCTDNLTDDDILHNVSNITQLPEIKSSSDLTQENSASGITQNWRVPIYAQTNYLKEHKWSFSCFSGGNVGHAKKTLEKVGYYDEDFQAWGREDNEMGYRIYNAGYYFIPVMNAVGLHQEPPNGENETNRTIKIHITGNLIQEKAPPPLYRKYEPHKIYEVPKVSIYIPAYNAAKCIKQAVDSALNQTYTDLEVCICNDGSTDNTLEVLEQNYHNHPRVHWVSQANGGIGKASNTAVHLCRGMYIGQLDADDFLKPHAVELAVRYLDNMMWAVCIVLHK